MMVPRNWKDSTMSTDIGHVQREAGVFVKSVTISTARSELSNRLLWLNQDPSESISSPQETSSPLEMSPMNVLSSANFRSLTDW